LESNPYTVKYILDGGDFQVASQCEKTKKGARHQKFGFSLGFHDHSDSEIRLTFLY